MVVGRLGLRYDDLFDPMEDLDIKEALARLPREIVDARNQRLKRAMDLSMKHEYLPKDLQVKCLDSMPLFILIDRQKLFRFVVGYWQFSCRSLNFGLICDFYFLSTILLRN